MQPYTEQEISFAFHSFERVKISIQAICEVAGGLPQILTIRATADIVKCEIEDHALDYGLQVKKKSYLVFNLINRCSDTFVTNLIVKNILVILRFGSDNFKNH